MYKFKDKNPGLKVNFEGTKKVMDIETGEILDIPVIEKYPVHTLKKGWRRVYLENFMEVLSGLFMQNRKIDLVEFILDNLDSENKFIMTYDEIQKNLEISRPIIAETFKYLTAVNFMRKKRGSCYIINPKFVCAFGSDRKNNRIMIEFYESEDEARKNKYIKNKVPSISEIKEQKEAFK